MSTDFSQKNLPATLASRMFRGFAIAVTVSSALLAACGGGEGCTEAPAAVFTPDQISNMTRAQAAQLRDVEIISMGANFKLMNLEALSMLIDGAINNNPLCPVHKSPIGTISPDQVASLSTTQVRYIGSNETGVAKLYSLSLEAFQRLMTEPVQVSALTVKEFNVLPSQHFRLIDLNVQHLTDPVISSYKDTFVATRINTVAPIQSLTPSQVDVLSTAQLRLLGTASAGTPRYMSLEPNSFERMMQRPANVAAITPFEFSQFENSDIVLLGANIKHLTDDVISNIAYTFRATPTNTTTQIGALTGVQVAALSPSQMALIFARNDGKGIGNLDTIAFGSLSAAQVSSLMPFNITTVRAEQLARLSTATIAGIPADTRAAFTPAQKAMLSSSQAALFQPV